MYIYKGRERDILYSIICLDLEKFQYYVLDLENNFSEG
jgi:hypothetical protein